MRLFEEVQGEVWGIHRVLVFLSNNWGVGTTCVCSKVLLLLVIDQFSTFFSFFFSFSLFD